LAVSFAPPTTPLSGLQVIDLALAGAIAAVPGRWQPASLTLQWLLPDALQSSAELELAHLAPGLALFEGVLLDEHGSCLARLSASYRRDERP
jgi:hypothetical protein